MIGGWVVVLAALIYVCGLFAIAHFGDVMGHVRLLSRGRSTIYALTLAVYCTSWTFFGSVGLASRTGFDFLAIYLGPVLLIGFGNRIVRRVVGLAKSQNIQSVSDFVGARYGKSASVAAIVAVIAVIGSIPYIALQLKAISVSLHTMLDSLQGGGSFPPAGDLALVVALVLGGFTAVFGTRHIDSREYHGGLMTAVAVESLIKLAAFLIVGVFVTWGMFGGVSQLIDAVAARPDITPLLERSGGIASWVSMTGLSVSIILLLPRQFHVTVVENRDERDIARAAWLFPLYLLLINLFVVPIAMGADLTFLPGAIDRDMAMLELPLAAGNGIVALIAFLGGFSAATAMVIVECLALGTMVSNDLVMPVLLSDGSRLLRRRSGDLGGRVLAIRRVAIMLVLLAGYAYYRVTSDAALASIGLVSFAAIAQIAPAFFGGLIWKRATALGATAGLVAGLLVWAYTLILPSLANPAVAGLEAIVRNGLFGIGFLKPTALFGTDLASIAHGALFSLLANLLAYVSFSYLRPPSSIETVQADLFVSSDTLLVARNFRPWRTSVNVGELKAVVARYLGSERTAVAFAGLADGEGIPTDDQAADIHTLRFAEHQLASAIGAASSRQVLSLLLSRSNVSRTDALRLLDDASAAIQYSRDLLQHALDHARQGVTVFDTDMKLLCWNREFQTLFGLPDFLLRSGTALSEIIRFNAERGLYGPGRRDRLTSARMRSFVTDMDPVRLRLYPDQRTLEIRSARLPDGGIVTTYADVTDTVRAEEALASANESLEGRVRERTEALLRLNQELTRAKAEAEDANLSKTRFLAAASHDILQPLNAARLYVAALLERDQQGGDARLAENVATSLEAVEDILTTLLEISRLDAGAMKPEWSQFPLNDVLAQLKVELMPMAEEKGLKLVFVPTTLVIRSDRRLVRRLIQNLVSNAIKYTPRGRVIVGCRRGKGLARLEVHDTGIGIPLSQQKAIFREFKRLDEGAKVARGLGLGLSIVERIARVLRHPVRLTSEVGKGSVFSVDLPIGDAKPQASRRDLATPHLSAPLIGMRIVAVDNEPNILDGMRALLEGWGCLVETAPGQGEALAACARLSGGPDAIIADYHLDRGTGVEVIDAIRAQYVGQLPAILVTADRSDAVRDLLRARDIVLMHKPLKPAGLRALLAQIRAARIPATIVSEAARTQDDQA